MTGRRTNRLRRWAVITALFLGILGPAHLNLRPSDGALRGIGWVWPIALVVLVVMMVSQAHRLLRSWSRPLILYPVFAVLLLDAVGGAYETVSETTAKAIPANSSMLEDSSCTSAAPARGSPTVMLEPRLGGSPVRYAACAQTRRWQNSGKASSTRSARECSSMSESITRSEWASMTVAG